MQLSANSKDRYESKILAYGLNVDPFAIENCMDRVARVFPASRLE